MCQTSENPHNFTLEIGDFFFIHVDAFYLLLVIFKPHFSSFFLLKKLDFCDDQNLKDIQDLGWLVFNERYMI